MRSVSETVVEHLADMRAGFTECPPFADYRLDPNSVFMTLGLQPGADKMRHASTLG